MSNDNDESQILICAADVKPPTEPPITVSDGFITIDAGYPYQIDLKRCDTSEKLLGWIIHLTEKSWMTNMMMRKFIQVATRENKITINYNS